MLTLTTPVPKGFVASPLRPRPTSGSSGRRCRRHAESGQTRNDVLLRLAGADSGRFPYLPRRRRSR